LTNIVKIIKLNFISQQNHQKTFQHFGEVGWWVGLGALESKLFCKLWLGCRLVRFVNVLAVCRQNLFFKMCGGKIFKTFSVGLCQVTAKMSVYFVVNVDVCTVVHRLPTTSGSFAKCAAALMFIQN
jgi:hypothetical protein